MSIYNIRDFGAVGDGLATDTAAIQRAIDTCHEQGGGKVLLPAGKYRSGTIYLKSNVEFHLANGAHLLASAEAQDYNPENNFPENIAFSSENVTSRHFIIAYQQENISITGQGIIDGGSSQFFEPLPENITASYRYKSGNYPITDWRPGQMIFFCRCKNVVARDVRLFNSPYWTFFLLGCENVQIRGLLIENPPATPNGDGIDIDCCKNVTISDCIISSGDDAITLRGNSHRLGKGDWICENIVVSNCILRTPCNAIRVGVGDGHVRKVLFTNINIPEASRGISLVSLYRKTKNSQHGTRIEDIHFSQFLIDADVPITAGTGHESQPPATIDNITFRDFRIIAHAGAQLVGTPDVPIGKVLFQNIDWSVRDGTDNISYQKVLPRPISHHGYKGREGNPALPCALLCVDIADLSIENLTLRWENPSVVWREGILLQSVQLANLNNLHLRQPQADTDQSNSTAISCEDTKEIILRNCLAASGTSTFLCIKKGSTLVRYGMNDFSEAKIPFCCENKDKINATERSLRCASSLVIPACC